MKNPVLLVEQYGLWQRTWIVNKDVNFPLLVGTSVANSHYLYFRYEYGHAGVTLYEVCGTPIGSWWLDPEQWREVSIDMNQSFFKPMHDYSGAPKTTVLTTVLPESVLRLRMKVFDANSNKEA